MRKKHGWVIEMKKNSSDYPGFYQIYVALYSGPLRTAFVCRSRQFARRIAAKDETARKVEFYKNGKPKKVVGRG